MNSTIPALSRLQPSQSFILDASLADAVQSSPLCRQLLSGVAAPAMFVADPENHKLLLCNASACRLLGIDSEATTILPSIIPALVPRKLQQLWREVQAHGQTALDTELTLARGQRAAVGITFGALELNNKSLLVGYIGDIREPKQHDENLRKHQTLLSEAQRIAHIGSWELDLIDNVLTWSDEVFRMFEIDPKQFIATYEAFILTVHPEDREAVGRAYAESLENRLPYQIEHRLLMADGRVKYVLERCETRYGEDGAALSSMGTVQDITERKRLEIQLQQQLDFQETLLNAMYEVGLQVMVIENAVIVHVGNRKLARRLGYSDAEIDGRTPLIDIIHPDDRPRVMDYYRRRVAGEAVPNNYEIGLLNRDGERVEFEVSVAMVPNSDPVRIVTVGKDISERKQIEMERRQLHDVLTQSADFIGSANLDRTVSYLNPAGLRMAGWPEDMDFSGLKIADFHPPWVCRMLEETALPAAMENGSWRGESALLHRDGHEVPVSQLIMLHRDAGGNPLFVSTIMTDITARKAADRQLALLNYALDRVGDSVALIAENADLVYVNQAFCHGLAYDREQMLTMAIPDIDPDYHHERWPEHWRELKANRAMLFETRHRTRNGVVFPVEVGANYFEYDGVGYNLALMRNITGRKRIENTLSFIAQRGWQQDGESFLTALARYLGEMLAIDYVVIDKLAEIAGHAETVALYARGEIVPNMQYALKDSPCENVMEGELCCYPAKVQQRFPKDVLLVEMGVESYIGLPLCDSAGKVIGLIALMDGKPIADVSAVTALLQLVATRASAELERGQSERALAESRQFLQQVIDTVADPIFVKDRQHRWLLLNRAYCRLMGRPADVLLGKSDYDFFPAEQADVFWAKDEEVFAYGACVNEEAFTDAGGLTHTIVTSKTCFTGAKGGDFLVGTIKDITDLKQIQRDLENTGNRLRSVLQTMPDYVWLKDPDGVYLACNPAFERLYGSSAADIVGKTDYDFVEAELAGFFRRKDREAMDAAGISINEEWVTLAASGNRVLLETRKVPVYAGGGKLIGVLGIGRDITERKRMEDLLAQREREFRTLVENLPTYVVRLDVNLHRVYVNPAYTASLGIPETEVLGSHVSQYWRATNVSAADYSKILRAVLRFGEQQEVSLEWSGEDGRMVSHLVRIAPEFDHEGEIKGALILGFDVSERRRHQLLEAERQRVFERVAHGDDLDGILQQVALYVEASQSGRRCLILMLEEEGRQLQHAVAPSFSHGFRDNLHRMLSSERACPGWAEVVAHGERVIIEDLSGRSCIAQCLSCMDVSGVKACWSEPVYSSARQLLGVVSLYVDHAGAPEAADLTLLLQASHLSGIAIERKCIEQQMYRQATYDALTGLPNRRLFAKRLHEEIARAERGGYPLALLFIDLDRFKEVNDTLGHAHGDRLLAEAAQRIREQLRDSDTLARLAGDEFVAILPEARDRLAIERIAGNLAAAVAAPFYFGQQSAFVSASIGIAVYPQDAGHAEGLLGCADQAMYAAKESGRNGYSFFTGCMLEHAQHRLQLAKDLREALDKGQMDVFYQPIIDAASGKALKAEALLRWRHPELGMVPPDRFISIAEETDLIQDIGTWVFCQAAETNMAWNAECNDGCLRQISVNVSPRQFLRGNPEVVCIDYLRSLSLNPAAMVIEITEGLLLDDQADIQEKLCRFHEAGIQLALDDFGTGYSAMAYLKKFNIDYLKIDKSFIRDLETDSSDRAIAEAIMAMAHRLGLKVIAEGVETKGQRDLLAAAGCEYLQGYLYAKPMPRQAFLKFVGNGGG